jgi:type II secretory pathway pseudopilin PulG
MFMNETKLKRRAGGVLLLVGILLLGTITAAFAEGVRKRIKFARGRNSTVISNAVLRAEIDQYLLGARAGQRMKVEITSLEANAAFQIQRPDNKGMLPGATFDDDATTWTGELPDNGDYVIEVAPTRGNATYRLKVEIR